MYKLFCFLLVILLGVFIIAILVSKVGTDIVSKTPIKPSIKIIIKDGVADTTYIYKSQ